MKMGKVRKMIEEVRKTNPQRAQEMDEELKDRNGQYLGADTKAKAKYPEEAKDLKSKFWGKDPQ